MRSLTLSQHRRANVWLDEAPPADFTAVSVVTRLVKPIVAVDATRQLVGIELAIPHGARASYGLLGAELIQANVEGLEIRVSVSNVGFPFRSSIAVQPDEVSFGLPDEYANAVLVGAGNVAATIGAPMKSTLWFRWAAHGLVGSSLCACSRCLEIPSMSRLQRSLVDGASAREPHGAGTNRRRVLGLRVTAGARQLLVLHGSRSLRGIVS